MKKPDCIAPTGCLSGEGPVWSPTEGFLWWVDTKRAKLHRYNHNTGNTRRYDLPLHASVLALWHGEILMAGDRELGLYDPATESYETRHTLVGMPTGSRISDGGVTPDGGFLLSTMDEHEQEACGQYYLIKAGQLPLKLELPEVLVSRTLVFAPDGKTFYTCDTAERVIIAHDYDSKNIKFSNARVFSEASHLNGFPDGSAVDVEGGLWTCEWGAGRVVRRSPDGHVTDIIEIDAPQPKCCVFGGDEMKTLFITTARWGLTDKLFEQNPLSGGLFSIDVPVAGLPPGEIHTDII